MKKNILYLFITAVCVFSSCDLQRDPFDSYTQEQIAAQKGAAADVLLNGCYGRLKGWSDLILRVGEYPADNIAIRNTSSDSFFSFISYSHAANNGRLYNFWSDSYKAITQASEITKLIEEGISDDLDQKIGEAYYIRALSYFYLCNVFGRPYGQSPETNLGVPLLLKGIQDANNIEAPDRSTVEQTYAQIVSDLKKAEQLMNKDKSADYATKYAAQALLSRVYLYMSGAYDSPNGEYAKLSIEYADKVISSGKYALLSRANFMQYNTMAPDANGQTETIFAVKRIASEFSSDDYYNSVGGMYSTILGVGWGEMFASAKYLDLLRESGGKNDARWAFIDPQYKLDDNGLKIPSFRFVIKLFNNGVQTGYSYVDQPLQTKADGSYYITYQEKEYPLSLVNADTNEYSISYDGETYVGEKDYEMLKNMILPRFYVLKCSLQDGQTQLHSPTVSRLAELYLNKAEAYVKLGDYENARTNLNIIRGRAIVGGEYSGTQFNSANAIELVDKERQLELAFEAHRAYDVYRNGFTMKRAYPGAHPMMAEYPATSPLVVQPIPQKEIDAYKGYGSTLTQNP